VEYDDQIDIIVLVNKAGVTPTLPSMENVVDFPQWCVETAQHRKDILRSVPILDDESSTFVTQMSNAEAGSNPQLVLPLIAEVDSHDGEACSITIIEEPEAIISTGFDKKVKLWNVGDLKNLGILCMRAHKDAQWYFPYDSEQILEQRKLEAETLINSLPKKTADTKKDPKLALEDVKEKRKQTGLWKEKEKHSVISESTDDEDYMVLLDKMMSPKVNVACTDRLLQ
jgi:hypothetical protein